MHRKFKNPELFSPSIAEQGWHYFQNRRVGAIYDHGRQLYQAEISGSEPYQAWLQLDDNGQILEGGCDCPCDFPCKHMAALWYALQVEAQLGTEQADLPPLASLSALLEQQDAAALRKLLLTMAHDPAVYGRLMWLLDPGATANPYRCEIRQIFAAYRGDADYDDTLALEAEVQDWLDNVIRQGDTAMAAALPPLMAQLINAMAYTDDSEGELGGCLTAAIDELNRLLAQHSLPEAQLAQLIAFVDACLADSRYGDWGDYMAALYPIRAREWQQQQAFTEWQTWPDKQLATCGQAQNSWLYEFFADAKYQMLLAVRENQAAQRYLAQNLQLVSLRQRAVTLAMAAENWSEAEKLLNEGIRIASAKRHRGTEAGWEKQLLTLYRQTGRPLRTLSYKLAFDSPFSLDYYRTWKTTFTAEEWLPERDRLIEQLYRQHHEATLVEILLEERLFGPLLALLQRSNDGDILEAYGRQLPATYHAALLEKHLALLAQFIHLSGHSR